MTKPLTFGFDIDTTITGAPVAYPAIAQALKAAGHKIVVVTGHGPERDRKALLDELDFPYDEILIVDPGADGSGKAKVLETVGADFMFENDVAFGPAIAKVCPVTMLYVEPPGDKGAGKAAKKAAKNLKRTVLTGGPHDGEVIERRGLSNLVVMPDGSRYEVVKNGSAVVDGQYVDQAVYLGE